MYEKNFSRWKLWERREQLAGLEFPGVYILARSRQSFAERRFSWAKQIIYIGMTNAASGLRGRLQQFDNTIIGKSGHGGADRVRYKFPHYNRLVPRLYVSIAPFKCDVRLSRPEDLRRMGSVARFEYLCLAEYVERFGVLPAFNNKKSPKYSLTIGRSTIG